VEAEHRIQLQLVRALRQALAGQDRAASHALLEQLLGYSDAHFLSEKLLMRLHAYPAYEHHVQEHDRLVDELQALAASVQGGDAESLSQLLPRVEEWLLRHMQTTDLALEAFLAEQAPRSA
jgi:hemerythrin